MGTRTDTTLTLSLPVKGVFATDMLEEQPVETDWRKNGAEVAVPLSFRPFEIKTLRLKV